jgi:hypothetical protein
MFVFQNKEPNLLLFEEIGLCSNVSTTPIMAMGCRQCLPLSVVQLKGKHCRKPHCRNGVVDTFGPRDMLDHELPSLSPVSIVLAIDESQCNAFILVLYLTLFFHHQN